jgi:hypothetical protein
MAKIKLSEGGFTLIPEGTTTFKIVAVDYNEDFGKMKIDLQTKSGAKHTENFSLQTKSGEINDGALKAFSYFAKTALNDFSLEEIDHEDLVGCYITATVKHEEFESNKEPGKMLKSARLNDYAVAIGFGAESKNEEKFENIADNLDDDLGDFLDS